MELELEIKKLREILAEDYSDLSGQGDKLDGFETVYKESEYYDNYEEGRDSHFFITKTPSGRFLGWSYIDYEKFNPDIELKEYQEYEETVVLKKYKEKEGK